MPVQSDWSDSRYSVALGTFMPLVFKNVPFHPYMLRYGISTGGRTCSKTSPLSLFLITLAVVVRKLWFRFGQSVSVYRTHFSQILPVCRENNKTLLISWIKNRLSAKVSISSRLPTQGFVRMHAKESRRICLLESQPWKVLNDPRILEIGSASISIKILSKFYIFVSRERNVLQNELLNKNCNIF